MRLLSALVKPQEHTFLQNLSLDNVSRYARLVGHLKNNILLPQPIDQSDPRAPPDVLSPSLAGFLTCILVVRNLCTEAQRDWLAMWEVVEEQWLWEGYLFDFGNV